jgi:ElaB/YqjD/DUF883 family membrane-anchored ribosome-binding protein
MPVPKGRKPYMRCAVGDTMVEAIDDSLRKRPYTTLAIAVGIGFLFGAAWRR